MESCTFGGLPHATTASRAVTSPMGDKQTLQHVARIDSASTILPCLPLTSLFSLIQLTGNTAVNRMQNPSAG